MKIRPQLWNRSQLWFNILYSQVGNDRKAIFYNRD